MAVEVFTKHHYFPANMISSTCLRILRGRFRISYFHSVVPYKWDAEGNRLIVSQSRIRAAAFGLNFCLIFLYDAFLVFRVFQAYFLDSHESIRVGMEKLVKVLYNALAYALPLAFQLYFILRGLETVLFVNSFLHVFETFRGKLTKPFSLRNLKNSLRIMQNVFRFFQFVSSCGNSVALKSVARQF